jgi:hypothetical protein
MSASVKITGLKEVQAQIESFTKNLPKNADAIVKSGVNKMARDAKEEVPVDMGAMKGGISVKTNGFADYSLVSNASYSPYIEFGTKGNYQPIPGIDASEFKGKGSKEGGKGFFENILAWVKRKRIAGTYSSGIKRKKGGGFEVGGSKGRRVGKKADIERENEQVAWAIYLSIQKHGIKAHPFFFKQGDKHGPEIIKQIEQLVKQVKLNG